MTKYFDFNISLNLINALMNKEKLVLSTTNTQTVKQLINEQKTHIEGLHAQALKQAEKLGEQDGTLNLPKTEDALISPNESMLRHEYQKLIADCWHKGKSYLDGPHLAYRTFMEKLEDLRENKVVRQNNALELIDQRKKDQMDFTFQEYEVKEERVMNEDKILKRDFLVAKQTLQTIQERVGRNSPIIHFKSGILYILLLLGIGISEVPLNLQIFQKFGEAFFITIIMASSLAIAIPVLAHFTGVFIKQRKEKGEYLFFAIVCILLFFVFNFGISIFRAYVLAENIGQESNQLNIVIFTCLNLILFIIGVLAAYFRHDESYELEHAYDHYMVEKKKYDLDKEKIHEQLRKVRDERSQKVKAIQENYLKEKTNLNDQEELYLQRRNEAIQNYDEILNGFIALEAYLESAYKSTVEKYRAANLMHRQDHLSPTAWRQGIASLNLKFNNCQELDPN